MADTTLQSYDRDFLSRSHLYQPPEIEHSCELQEDSNIFYSDPDFKSFQSRYSESNDDNSSSSQTSSSDKTNLQHSNREDCLVLIKKDAHKEDAQAWKD